MTQLTEYVWGLIIPENYWAFHIDDFYVIAYPEDGGGGTKAIGWHQQLPEGSWEIIGTSDEMSEEKAAGIVEKEFPHDFYVNYADPFGMWTTTLESFQSLLLSKGLKGRVLLLKKLSSK